MIIEYPKMLYKVPGPYEGDGGIKFDYLTVLDDEQEADAVNNGWSLSLDSAVGGGEQAARAGLEKEAGELGIKFDGRTTDAALAKRIEDALKS